MICHCCCCVLLLLLCCHNKPGTWLKIRLPCCVRMSRTAACFLCFLPNIFCCALHCTRLCRALPSWLVVTKNSNKKTGGAGFFFLGDSTARYFFGVVVNCSRRNLGRGPYFLSPSKLEKRIQILVLRTSIVGECFPIFREIISKLAKFNLPGIFALC